MSLEKLAHFGPHLRFHGMEILIFVKLFFKKFPSIENHKNLECAKNLKLEKPDADPHMFVVPLSVRFIAFQYMQQKIFSRTL